MPAAKQAAAATAPPADATPDQQLTAALAAAQADFPRIERRNTAEVRGRDGKPGYSYTYADLGDVLAAVRPVLAGHGLALVQRTVLRDGRVVLSTELRHVGGGQLTSEVELGQSSANPQQFGGALTYLRRYEIVTLLGIAAEEDRDAQDVEPARQGSAPQLPGWALEASDDRKRALVEALDALIGRDRAKALGSSCRESWGYVPDVVVAFAKALAAHHAGHQAAQQQDAAGEQPDPPAADEPIDAADAAVDEAQQTLADAEPTSGPVPGTVEVAPDLPPATLKRMGCRCENPGSKPFDDLCPIAGHGIPF